jgi:hypothetical protein
VIPDINSGIDPVINPDIDRHGHPRWRKTALA